MNTSSRFVVATHILVALSGNMRILGQSSPLKSDMLADSVNTNPVVIRRILSKLKSANLIDSKSGPNGGSVLLKDPAEITLKDIYCAVEEEGDLFHFHYCDPNQKCPVGLNIKDAMIGTLTEAENATKAVLAKTSLQDLLNDIMQRAGLGTDISRQEIREEFLAWKEQFT